MKKDYSTKDVLRKSKLGEEVWRKLLKKGYIPRSLETRRVGNASYWSYRIFHYIMLYQAHRYKGRPNMLQAKRKKTLKELIEYVKNTEPEFQLEEQRKLEEKIIKKELANSGKTASNYRAWTDEEMNKALFEEDRKSFKKPERTKGIVVEVVIENRLRKLSFFSEAVANVRTLLKAIPKSNYEVHAIN